MLKKMSMIKYVICVLTVIISIFVFSGLCISASLHWDAYTDENADGFLIYSQMVGGKVVHSVKIDNISLKTYPLDTNRYIPGNKYRFWMTAYNKFGESERSNIAIWNTPELKEFVPVENPPDIVINIPKSVGRITVNVGE